jgi:hypothetical protein
MAGMLAIRWTESADEYESLALCLRAGLAGGQPDPPAYDELVATLGLGSAMTAAPGECLGWWWTYARELALEQAAALYGLRLRGLHPPQASAGLDRSPEFAQHFVDSYVPLIRQALAHEQPLFAWRGWPPPADRQWGVLVAADGGQLSGYTLGCEGRTVPFVGPAHQVYVVEGRPAPQATITSASAWFQQSCRAAVAFWEPSSSVGDNIELGQRAYRLWRESVEHPPACPLCGGRSSHCVAQLARVLASARRHQAAWLERLADRLDNGRRAQAERWAAACHSMAERLQPYGSEQPTKAALQSPLGREQLAQAIAEVGALESRLIESLPDV